MKNTKKLTTEEFINRSKEIHGDNKYDYSMVEYINSLTKLSLIHNGIIYEQLASNHLKGFKCENIKGLTQEDFISKSKEIHGDKYDYSLVNFKNVRGKIKLIHNGIVYKQFAYANLQGKSPEMAPFKITNNSFIKRARLIHGDMFDYSLVNCNGSSNKIKIIYNGIIYEQIIMDHLRGCIPRGIIIESKGVRDITYFLEINNIEYIREHFYYDCKNINYLRFDFYLPKIKTLIEYDGKQHFEIVEFFGGEEEFIKRQINDNIKNEYCKKNRIPLLRISYLEDVNFKLGEYFSKHYI